MEGLTGPVNTSLLSIRNNQRRASSMNETLLFIILLFYSSACFLPTLLSADSLVEHPSFYLHPDRSGE